MKKNVVKVVGEGEKLIVKGDKLVKVLVFGKKEKKKLVVKEIKVGIVIFEY